MLDRLTLDHLGIDAALSAAYLETAQPDYLQYETWVRANAAKADATSVAEHNAALREHRDHMLQIDLHDWKRLHMSTISPQVI
jgi:hypothetical protein